MYGARMPFQSKELLRIASRKSPFGQWSVHCRCPGNRRRGVAAEGLFAEAHRLQRRVADHQVARDQGHLDHVLPIRILGGRRLLQLLLVQILAFLAVLLGPRQCLVILGLVVNAFGNPAVHLAHVDILGAHAQVVLEEVRVHERACDAHRRGADREIGLAAHHRHGETTLDESQQYLAHVGRHRGVGAILHLLSVNAMGRQPLLRVTRQHCRQIDRARTLRAVEAPHRLGQVGVGVHGLRTVAPAGRHRQRHADVLLLEFRRAGRRFGAAADVRVGEDALYGRTVRILQVLGDQLRRALGHVHGLVFQRLAHTAPTPVDHRADADPGETVGTPNGSAHKKTSVDRLAVFTDRELSFERYGPAPTGTGLKSCFVAGKKRRDYHIAGLTLLEMPAEATRVLGTRLKPFPLAA